MNRVEIENRSDNQRTVIARRSHDIRFIERVSTKVKVFSRANTSAGDRLISGGPPHDDRRPPDGARCDTRPMNPM
ncbi:hypothetical protein DPMN_122138 [Dreissena polymorpha]|uniref:Uncharacterized protein n=1 Tax=Dreissena polymorpha TaxID=45954 RepID=A0A9D4GP35_DREPO|nr:hypothetical protein DPMN_122138 [Dreissena polymorpha]